MLLKTDYEYFAKEGEDITDELSEDDKAELISMASEAFRFDIFTPLILPLLFRFYQLFYICMVKYII